MDKNTTGIVAYLTWIGLLIAYIMGDREEAKFHLNQSLVIWLAGTLAGIAGKLVGWIPLLGWLMWVLVAAVELFCVICWFIGVVGAVQGQERPVPVLGHIKLLY